MINLLTFDLNLLKVLDALLETGSLTETGKRIGLTQPAVSAALGRLRHALGDPLMIRHGRRMVPTDFAADLRDPLRAQMVALERILSGPGAFDPARARARFRLSGSDFFAELLMPQLADHVARLAPGITVQLVDLVADRYIDTLDRYQVDIALIPETPFPDWVDYRRMFLSPFVAIARADHPRLRRAGLAPGDTIPLDLFCDLGHVLFSPEGKTQAMGDAALARVGRKRKVVMTMPVFSGIYNSVAESDLVALMPVQLARRMAPKVGIAIYDPPMPIEPAPICMAWHKRSTENPTHQWMRDQIMALMTPLGEDATPPTD